ncbi:MAG: hypothetical protein KDA89_19005, partial [Planctomycetaceae bacterium]|nr:hypothetical protein [Planctomycetaceae bacterium]
MATVNSRRRFLTNVSRGVLLASLGPGVMSELRLVPPAFGAEPEQSLTFGDMEPLVRLLQETPVERLQGSLLQELENGRDLKTLIAAGALANARTFGGEDYIGFHTFMALAPALKMSAEMPTGEAALPVFKVLYRNTNRIQEFGGRESEVLHPVSAGDLTEADAKSLHDLVMARDVAAAERRLQQLATDTPAAALDAVLECVFDNPEVHRTVLPYRAWDMQQIVGPQYAGMLLRQSLRYCVNAETHRRSQWEEHAAMLSRLMNKHGLHDRRPGSRSADDEFVEQLSRTFATASPVDSAEAAASALAEDFAPAVIGEAISLAA